MEDDIYEYDLGVVWFEGPCTCDHDEEQHGWGSCAVEDCQCVAGWYK